MAIPYVVPGADYWHQRALREDAVMDQLATQAEQNLVGVMHELNAGMQAAVDRFIVQYLAGNTEVAYSDLAKTLQPSELKAFKRAINELSTSDIPQTQAANRIARAARRVNRIDALTSELSQWLNVAAGRTAAEVQNALGNVYDAESTLRAGAIRGAGVRVSLNSNSAYQLKAVANQRFLSESFSDRIWSNKDALLQQLARNLPQMFIAGADNGRIVSEIRRVTGVSQSAASRIVRTEGARVATQADSDLYASSKTRYYIYMATIDSRTSQICSEMNGRRLEVSKMESGITAPPLHPNCRSTTVPDVDTTDIDDITVLEAEEAVAKKYGGIARPRNAQGVIVVDTPDAISKRLRSARASKE
jgi:SPP1 gp7 family putative phage head morphogenesis protein